MNFYEFDIQVQEGTLRKLFRSKDHNRGYEDGLKGKPRAEETEAYRSGWIAGQETRICKVRPDLCQGTMGQAKWI